MRFFFFSSKRGNTSVTPIVVGSTGVFFVNQGSPTATTKKARPCPLNKGNGSEGALASFSTVTLWINIVKKLHWPLNPSKQVDNAVLYYLGECDPKIFIYVPITHPLQIFLEGYAFALNHPTHICVIWCVLNANIKVTACFDMMLLPQVFCGNQKTVRWHPKTKKAEPTKWWSLLFATGVEIIGNSNWFGF